MGHANGELVRALYDAFQKADLETIQNSLADDVVIHMAGRSPLAGDHKGKNDSLGLLGEFISKSNGTFKAEVHDILANDDHVVVLSNVTAQGDGKSLDVQGIEIFHVKDGKVTEAYFTSMDQHASDEFFS